jgi:hypothetical protein
LSLSRMLSCSMSDGRWRDSIREDMSLTTTGRARGRYRETFTTFTITTRYLSDRLFNTFLVISNSLSYIYTLSLLSSGQLPKHWQILKYSDRSQNILADLKTFWQILTHSGRSQIILSGQHKRISLQNPRVEILHDSSSSLQNANGVSRSQIHGITMDSDPA